MAENQAFYITTPIYYVNDVPHIGHAYCTIAADTAARFMRSTGRDVFFLTGTDEHGQKVEKAAAARGVDPQTHADQMTLPFQGLWNRLLITNDDFIRTTQSRHIKTVQEIFERLRMQGDIYEGKYEGWYCIHEENFWPESQVDKGNCPDCGRPVEKVTETNYFFAASKYGDRLRRHINDKPDFILPATRRNEVMRLMDDGVRDVCVSRTAFKWGVPLTFDPRHVTYVWFDALINYLSALGYPEGERYERFWPAIHLVGKDILKFHAIIWPCMLMALDVELPRQIFAHGFWTLGEEKISKSKGNVVEPNALIDEFGADAVRYFLLREIALGADGEFTREALIKRINFDLANDFGNMLHRTIPMMIKYFNGVIPAPGTMTDLETAIKRQWQDSIPQIADAYMQLNFKEALELVWILIGSVNKYIDESAPWTLAKNGETDRLQAVMYMLADCIRSIAAMVAPVLPIAAQKTWEQLGIHLEISEEKVPEIWQLGAISPGSSVVRSDPLFPRIEVAG